MIITIYINDGLHINISLAVAYISLAIKTCRVLRQYELLMGKQYSSVPSGVNFSKHYQLYFHLPSQANINNHLGLALLKSMKIHDKIISFILKQHAQYIY